MKIEEVLSRGHCYTLHSHTQFCDGRAPMEVMAEAAFEAGMTDYAFTPHCPTVVASPCNMDYGSVPDFIAECERLKRIYAGRMNIYCGMEIDYISPDYGPHSDYYQSLPLDLRIGSVHFVPTLTGEYVDCDGSADRFKVSLRERFDGDLRYVVEKYFEQVSNMLALGGFDILGHFDKIAGNASAVVADIEDTDWYESLMARMIEQIVNSGVAVEINTKAYERSGRFFPAQRWWSALLKAGVKLVVNSDAHRPELVNAGRQEALAALAEL